MEARYMDVRDCRNGDILAEDILNKYGAAVIFKGTEINDSIKKRLIELGESRIRVSRPDVPLTEERADDTFQAKKQEYKENVAVVKELISSLATGKKLDLDAVNTVTEKVFNELDKESTMVKCISELKHADEYTYSHCVNVSFYSMLIGKWMRMDEKKLKEIITAGMLHDIGKARIPPEILNKPGKLLPEEFDIIKKHPVYGYEAIKDSKDFPEHVKKAVLMHHEREDGSGYPGKAKADGINLFTCIVAVADVFDAMTSNRVYQKARTPFEAFEELENSGLGYLNANALKVFLENIVMYYIGTKVMLNTGESGEIVHIPPHKITKPLVMINGAVVDLSKRSDLKIARLM